MNNNRTDERAILAGCKGVFSATGYITIGSKEKAEPYRGVPSLPKRNALAGKQFETVAPKDGKTIDAYFEKKHNWIFDGDHYVDRLFYATKQPEKKRGFLTSDFSRRDEFSTNFRTEQYREQLSQEEKFAKQALEVLGSVGGEKLDAGTEGRQQPLFVVQEGVDKPFLYDLVFEKEDAAHNGASKVACDTKNPTVLSKDRNFGTMMTTTLVAHGPPTEFHKPQFARKPIVKNTFYRKTNIKFPDGCAAVEEAV